MVFIGPNDFAILNTCCRNSLVDCHISKYRNHPIVKKFQRLREILTQRSSIDRCTGTKQYSEFNPTKSSGAGCAAPPRSSLRRYKAVREAIYAAADACAAKCWQHPTGRTRTSLGCSNPAPGPRKSGEVAKRVASLIVPSWAVWFRIFHSHRVTLSPFN